MATRRPTPAAARSAPPRCGLIPSASRTLPGLTIDPAVSPLYVNRINAFYGAVTNANKILIGNADAVTLVIQRGATGIGFGAGSLDVAPTFNVGAGGLALVYAQSPGAPIRPGPRSRPPAAS